MDPYFWGTTWALVWILAVCRGQTDEDEKRPYKFAFAIEGYQHRSEEKDERGIIMGEFGFVTGDGVYHVTVYATDENGNFKILSMKNFYIGLPGEGTTAAPSRAPPTTIRTTTTPPSTPSTTKSPILKHLEGLMGCSGCIVPNKKNGQNGKTDGGSSPNSINGEGLLDVRFGGSPEIPARPQSSQGSPGKPQIGSGQPTYNKTPGVGVGKQPFNSGKGGSNSFPSRDASKTPSQGNKQGAGPSQYNPPGGQFNQSPQGPTQGVGSQKPPGGGFGSTVQGDPYSRPEGSIYDGTPEQGKGQPGKPGSQKVGVQSSRPEFSPNLSGGLPPGMSIEDMMALLYKFNYTLKYHGHHESGYRNGDKEGGYFFNGRDGLGRNVKYIANEFGFQPNITLVDLGLQSPDTPQGENEENTLRGNEFKWFYNR